MSLFPLLTKQLWLPAGSFKPCIKAISKPAVNSLGLSLLSFAALLFCQAAVAGDRLLATGGVSQMEGAAGGGLTPWALITGYGTDRQIGASAHYSHARTRSGLTLDTGGLAIGIHDRIEVSISQQKFDLGGVVPKQSIKLDTFGIKVKLIGDATFDQDRYLPQISAGVLVKHNEDFDVVPRALGAKHANGADFYLAATKLYLGAFFGRNVLLNATAFATKANQFGLLGFGGDDNNHYRIKPAASLAIMLDDNLLLGAEYRAKPDNLSIFKEEHAADIFVTWFPGKNFSITGAYLDLGNIASVDNQTGWYISGQAAY